MTRKHTYSLGLIGYPLGHSLSPQIHHAALQALDLKGEYRLYPISPLPEGQPAVETLLDFLRLGTLRGLNVTIPHKQAVIPLLDDLTPIARAVGAVNTIFREGERLIGDNTDVPGFLADFERFAPCLVSNPGSAMILGCGGAARAVAYALANTGWQLSIVPCRKEDEQQARDLATDIQIAIHNPIPEIRALVFHLSSFSLHPSLILNTTPLGMVPHINACPWPEEVPFPANVVLYDLVYNPPITKLVAVAHTAGIPATTGLGMLVAQAALSFERWTGLRPPIDVMRQAAENSIQST
jgi:shikimate dehydrogenase